MKLLIIEDEASLRELMQRSLEKERYVVECAPDFRTAMMKIGTYDYDCVLLDIMLPDGNGLAVLEELKNIDVGNLTPIDALNTIYRLQNKLKNRW